LNVGLDKLKETEN